MNLSPMHPTIRRKVDAVPRHADCLLVRSNHVSSQVDKAYFARFAKIYSVGH